ncbi:hypothetical protein [Caulobacter phage Cr30]|uniref:tail protein n=1 Tax=Caulobacter phage Cr30 TaxID=1357714 RepID=UPI0004A9B459|nr:tail protein [Caulobacter phage Cr30]AGS81103.1 hypothetical protein [Caulobacter phage Cr30]
MAQQGIESFNIGGKLQNLEVTLTNYKRDKILDIRSIVSDIVFYENIFAETMHGHLTIIDAVGLLSGYGPFQILGEEYLNIKYSIGDPSRPERDLTFFVYDIGPIVNAQNLKHKRYMLSFCSEENIIDAAVNVQKSYRQPHSESIKDIVKNFLKSKKPIDVLETKGIHRIVIPLLSPFKAIDLLRRRSISTLYSSASYLFFETVEGFKFKDIESLIVDGKKKIDKDPKYYTYTITESGLQNTGSEESSETTSVDDPRNYNQAQFKTLYNFTQSKKADTVEKLKRGMFHSTTMSFDPVNVSLKSDDYRFNSSKTKSLGKYQENSKAFSDDFTNNSNYTTNLFVQKDSSDLDSFVDEILPNRLSYMTRLAQNVFSADCVGDTGIIAGDVIRIPNVPAYKDIDGKGNTDELLSGDFLITGIVHKLTQETYAQSLEIYKNGYGKSVEDSTQ